MPAIDRSFVLVAGEHEEKVKKKREVAAQRKYLAEQWEKDQQNRLHEEAMLLDPEGNQRGHHEGAANRPRSRESSMSRRSGSNLFHQSNLAECWLKSILEAQSVQINEVCTLMDKLDGDRAVVISLGMTDTPANPLLNIPGKKRTGVAIGLGLNANDQQMEDWRERLTWVKEGRAEISNEKVMINDDK